MAGKFLHVGFGNLLPVDRVVAIVGPGSAPVKRMIREAREGGTCVDMTAGRKTKAVLVLDSGHVALAAITPETIAGRLEGLLGGPSEGAETRP